MRFAKLDRTSMKEAVLGGIDATGATGSIMAHPAFWETDGERQELDPDQIIAALLAAGASYIAGYKPWHVVNGVWTQ